MLVVPRKFMEVMNTSLVIKRLSRVVGLSANKRCVFWVLVQNFEGHMVLGRGWNYFCRHHRIVPGDLVVAVHLRTRAEGSDLQPRLLGHVQISLQQAQLPW